VRDPNRKRRGLTPRVESLESVTLLSGLAAPAALRAAPTAIAAAQAAVTLSMATSGYYATVQQNPDTGTTTYFLTFGTLPGIGVAAVAGAINTPGFIGSGQATGTLTVYTYQGTLSLFVTSALVPGFSTLPSQLNWIITQATGRFQAMAGGVKGSISVALHPNPGGSPALGAPVFGTAGLAFSSPFPIA
jgi:hypothetical protein